MVKLQNFLNAPRSLLYGPCYYRVSQKKVASLRFSPPKVFWHFSRNGWEFLVQILHTYYTFLSTLYYETLFNYLQLWRSYAILNATTIICSKCPQSAETHAGWSQLIWHNFVTVVDNCVKLCILAYIGTCNRHVKFGRKITNRLGKMPENPRGLLLSDSPCTIHHRNTVKKRKSIT